MIAHDRWKYCQRLYGNTLQRSGDRQRSCASVILAIVSDHMETRLKHPCVYCHFKVEDFKTQKSNKLEFETQNSLRMWASEWKPTMNIGPLKRVLKAISPWAYIFWGLLRYLVQLKLPFYLGCCVLACASLADSGAMGELQNKIASKLFW